MTPLNTHAFRLTPGQDLKKSIELFVDQQGILAGWISTCVGSLTRCVIRFANQPAYCKYEGYYEILSHSRTDSSNGSHLHISVADQEGRSFGGHMGDGCEIYTTAEIVLLSSTEFTFKREIDKQTGFNELCITV